MPVTLKFCLMIFPLILFRQTLPAQGRPWPVRYGYTPMQRSAPMRGFIVLTNGDTLQGYIKVFAFYGYYPILDTATDKVRNIDFSNIRSMHIYNMGPRGFIDYVHLPKENFPWKLDGKTKDVAIYDDILRLGTYHLIMVTPKARITLYKGRQLYSHYDKIDPLLIRFINERYKTGVKNEDFKSTQEIIDYILDKEQDLVENTRS